MPIAINVSNNNHIGGATGPMHTGPVDPAAADPDRHQGRAIPLEQTDVAVLVVCNEKLLMPIAINVGSNDNIGGATRPMHTGLVEPAAHDPDPDPRRALPVSRTTAPCLT